MEILPIAFDSFGVRSMACFIKTGDKKILIDPGVSLAPLRYGLEPHSLELKRLEECWRNVVKFASESDILIITHYHYDHYNPWENLEIYKDKLVLIKHPTEYINFSQRQRAFFFLEKIKGLPNKIEYCDGKSFKFNKTRIEFSNPVFHGTNQRLGWVVEVLIEEEKEKLVFTSDVEGLAIEDQINFILQNKPDFLIIDGPMTYMLGYRYSYESLKASLENLIKIIEETLVKIIILDHHLMRDLKYKEKILPVSKAGEKNGVKVISAAEFLGKSIEMLEAGRKELYQKYSEKSVKKVRIWGE
jgi:predicted metallo-beta-lactamase superfamily hydrolase